MSNVLTHRFTSPKLDGADATQVQPSAWNDGHRFSGGANGDVLTRDTTDATFGAKWVTTPPAEGWVAYTAVWYISDIATATTGHTITAAYHRRGNAVWYRVLFQVGTGSLPAGYWLFGLPFPCTPTLAAGAGLLRHTDGNAYALHAGSWNVSDRCVLYYAGAGTAVLQLFGVTAPVTLANGGVIEIRGNYQAA